MWILHQEGNLLVLWADQRNQQHDGEKDDHHDEHVSCRIIPDHYKKQHHTFTPNKPTRLSSGHNNNLPVNKEL